MTSPTEELRSLETQDSSVIERLADEVFARCNALAACTSEPGTIHRAFLSPAMARCNAVISAWMFAANMQVSQDQAGNLRGFYPAAQADAPCLLIASHLDTVPAAGKYDGVLGVVLGLALVESLEGKRLRYSIEVIGFSDEEGVRFGFPFIGSRAIVQTLEPEHLKQVDAHGMSLEFVLEAFAASHKDATVPRLSSRTRAYLEFHIEQGPVLDDAKQSLSTVRAITGQSRAALSFHGTAGHAGTTPMDWRRDAMVAAAEWILAVETLAKATPEIVATTGRVACEPGATNVIAGLVRCSLDLRTAGRWSPSDNVVCDARRGYNDLRKARDNCKPHH